MTRTVVRRPPPPALNVRASDVLADYEHWLETVYGSQGTYRHHAKSFLKRCRTGGQVLTQLDTFARRKSITGRSILNRFRRFLLEKNIVSVQNDLNVKALPLGNIYVKLFLLLNGDRIKSRVSKSTYATVLNGYFERIGELRHFQKVTAEGYVFQKGFSDFTSGLYASVLRSFAKWALSYLSTPNRELSAEERKIKDGLKRISQRSLRDVASIKATVEQRKLYHKESLSRSERDRLLKTCANRSERAMVALMAWNGLRPVEVTRLAAVDIDLRARTIAIQGKGRSRSKTTIVLFKVTVQELKLYLRDNKSLKDKLFPGLTYKQLYQTVESLFAKLKKQRTREKLSPHSLRHTAGQLLYDSGVPLEFIQRTLRHKSMQSTMVYANKAIERSYFKKMKKY